MKLLLDTHTFLWFVLGELKLSQLTRSIISDSTNEKWLSPASYWEVAIKASIGKYTLNIPHDVFSKPRYKSTDSKYYQYYLNILQL